MFTSTTTATPAQSVPIAHVFIGMIPKVSLSSESVMVTQVSTGTSISISLPLELVLGSHLAGRALSAPSTGSSRSPSDFSVRSTRSNIVDKKAGRMHKMNQMPTNSSIAASFRTPDRESQELKDATSRTSSPRKVLQEVKAKLAEYARLQELS
ncbi:hypothetical protein L7F22_040118 [Adiantum nelumboides]|nr:hypothetical protein [Adiantum nelumboides]